MDIKKYKSEGNKMRSGASGVFITDKITGQFTTVDRNDAIALAKHFKLFDGLTQAANALAQLPEAFTHAQIDQRRSAMANLLSKLKELTND